jgi:gamma-glutamyltranspeptidase/glutathione hydrolase
MAESMKRAYADRAKFLGDPDFNKDMPLTRLTSKEYATDLRKTIDLEHAAKASPTTFEWNKESDETTHISVVDANRNAVSMTYTLEQGYGVKIVVPGAGFLLNNEMGDFNAGPELTTAQGLVGTRANLAEPGKRMLSSMTPTILARNGELFMVTGSPGGRTIINTVFCVTLNLLEFGMPPREAIDSPRMHEPLFPDELTLEPNLLKTHAGTIESLRQMGHTIDPKPAVQGDAHSIWIDPATGIYTGIADTRRSGAAAGY